MKQNFKLMFFAAAAIVSVSCAKEQSIESPSAEGIAVKTLLRAHGNDVKSILDGLTLKWTEGDKIALFQYGKYTKGVTRDDTKNSFVYNTETGCFDGTVENYFPTEWDTMTTASDTTSACERFYACYPYANAKSLGVTTAQYSLSVPAAQTGLKADFGANAIYLGYVRQTTKDKPVSSYADSVLTITKQIEMNCVTPILKFSVPETLGATSISLYAYKEGAAAAISGSFKCRIDAIGSRFEAPSSTDPIVISRSGSVISGDVYVALAPNTNAVIGTFTSDIDSLVLSLSNADGASASIHSPKLSSVPTSGTIKNIGTLPGSVTWKYGKCPGIKEIAYASNAGNAGKFTVTAENSSSTLTYSKSSSSIADAGDPGTSYPSDGIARTNGADYLKFKISLDNYDDCYENAIVWGFTKSKAFGLYLINNFETNTVGSSCSKYDLTYTITTAGSSKAYPNLKSAGVDLMSGSSYSQGYLSFTAPQNGTGRIMIQSAGSSRKVTVTNTTKSSSVEKSLGSSQATVSTDSFSVSEGDIIKVELSGSVTVNSMSFVWEPTL